MASNVGNVQMGTFQYMPGMMGCFSPDFDYIDMSTSTYPMYDMGGSIFGSYPTMDMSGGIFGGTGQSYFDNMKQYQQFYNQYYIDQQKMNRNADLQVNASMEAVQGTAASLRDKILQNEQDQVMEAYKKYVDAVRSAYGAGTEQEVNARALSLYQQMTGKTLIQDLRDNSHCSALQGYIQTITLGAYSRRSAEDNIAEITHQSVPTGEKTEQNLGRLGGIATIGTAAYFGVKSLAGKTGSIAKYITKTFGNKAGLVGLAAAGIAAGLTFITGKIST